MFQRLGVLIAIAAAASLLFAACGAPEGDVVQVGYETDEAALRGGGRPYCCISCVAPPAGCHYEGMVGCGPCQKVTCGTLVCDGATL